MFMGYPVFFFFVSLLSLSLCSFPLLHALSNSGPKARGHFFFFSRLDDSLGPRFCSFISYAFVPVDMMDDTKVCVRYSTAATRMCNLF